MYSHANCNGTATLRMYHAQLPDRRLPDHRNFQRLHRQFRETPSFHFSRDDGGRLKAEHNPILEASISSVVADRPVSNTRDDAHYVRVSHETVCTVFNENRSNLSYFQRIQALNPVD
ncbi:hypothetical protein TNCV_600681 [Trichonephila clavipes]|nr:hypothetical protein TNCV_600681 [Trichonephila clavipes]